MLAQRYVMTFTAADAEAEVEHRLMVLRILSYAAATVLHQVQADLGRWGAWPTI